MLLAENVIDRRRYGRGLRAQKLEDLGLHPRGLHIDLVFQLDELLHHKRILCDDEHVHIRHGGDGSVRRRRILRDFLEDANGFVRGDEFQLHDVVDHNLAIRNVVFLGVGFDTFPSWRAARAPVDGFENIVSSRDERDAIQEQRALHEVQPFCVSCWRMHGLNGDGNIERRDIPNNHLTTDRLKIL